jgi:hypothetical protein
LDIYKSFQQLLKLVRFLEMPPPKGKERTGWDEKDKEKARTAAAKGH